MIRKTSLILVLAISVCFPTVIFAETILLKSGKTVEGKIVEKSEKYIKIEIGNIGVPITYYFDDIESIGEEKTVDSKGGSKAIRKMPFLTAVITYQDSGEVFNGEEIVYIDVAKNKVSRDTHVEGKSGYINKKIDTRDICDGKILVHVNYDEKKAPSFELKGGDVISNIFREEEYAKYYKEQKSFLGKECKVYSSIPGEEIYFWNGILLKQKITDHPMGKGFNVTKEAVDIQLNVSISDDKFEAPSGIKIMSAEETVEDMREMSESLKGMKKEDWEKFQKEIEKIGQN